LRELITSGGGIGRPVICEKCRAGQIVEYRRELGAGTKVAEIAGAKCDRCGFTQLDNDDAIWAAVGL
jgi:hypothetical protein